MNVPSPHFSPSNSAIERCMTYWYALQTARTACRSSSYIIEQMSSDSEVEDILLRTPTLQKLRTLDRLSTDALDPDTLQVAATVISSGQVRQSRPRDRQQRRSFSPLLDSTERDHYSVCRSVHTSTNQSQWDPIYEKILGKILSLA